MSFLLPVLALAFTSLALAHPHPATDELVMAQAEAKAYREAWLELKRRDELLGVATLSPEVHDAQDKIARLSGELIRAQKDRETLVSKVEKLVSAAVKWAGESDAAKKNGAQADFESAKGSGWPPQKARRFVPWPVA